jgi:hypothetical protein
MGIDFITRGVHSLTGRSKSGYKGLKKRVRTVRGSGWVSSGGEGRGCCGCGGKYWRRKMEKRGLGEGGGDEEESGNVADHSTVVDIFGMISIGIMDGKKVGNWDVYGSREMRVGLLLWSRDGRGSGGPKANRTVGG